MVKLYGKIIKGKESMSYEFTDKEFSKYFGKEEEFKKVVVMGLKPFDLKSDIEPTSKNENLFIVTEKNAICYSYNKANGPHPDRYQDRDDYTDWLKSDVGISKMSDVLEILNSLKK